MSLSGSITNANIIEAVAQNNGYTQQNASETVEILLELIKSTLKDSEYVLISRFGKFCVKKKKAARQKSSDRQRPDK